MFISRALWQKVIHSCLSFLLQADFTWKSCDVDQVHGSFLESWQNIWELWEHLMAAFQLQWGRWCVSETEQGRTAPRAWIQGSVKDMSSEMMHRFVTGIFTAADVWPWLIDTVCRSKLGFGEVGLFVCLFCCGVFLVFFPQGDENRKKIHLACMMLKPWISP